MYQQEHAKHIKYRNKRANKRKAAVLLSSLAVFLVLCVGVTIAFLIAKDNAVENTFNPSTVSCAVNESFDGTTKSNVYLSNTGDTEAYIRAAIVVTWKDGENGNVYGKAPVEGDDYAIELNLDDWIEGNDGYYYYKKPVAAGGQTAVLITECTAVQNNVPVGYGLNVEILGSAIQSVPVTVVEDCWTSVQVVGDAPHGDLAKAG